MSDRLDGVDLIFAVTQKATQAQFTIFKEQGLLHGNQQDASGKWTQQWSYDDSNNSGYALTGTLGVPIVSYDVKGQQRMVMMTFVLTNGTAGFWDGFGPSSKLVGLTFDTFRYTFYVNMDFAMIEQDALKKQAERLPASVPDVIKNYLHNPTGALFTPKQLFNNFENVNLANYEPQLSGFDGAKITKNGGSTNQALLNGQPLEVRSVLKQVQELLANYFSSLKGSDNPYVLGYALENNVTPDPAALWNPTNVSFSTYDNKNKSDLNTLNFLCDTETRRITENQGLLQQPLVNDNAHDGLLIVSAARFQDVYVNPLLTAILAAFQNFLAVTGTTKIKDCGPPYDLMAKKATEIQKALAASQLSTYWTLNGSKYELDFKVETTGDGPKVGSDSKMLDITLKWNVHFKSSVSLSCKDGKIGIAVDGSITFHAETWEPKFPVQALHDSTLDASTSFTYSTTIQGKADGEIEVTSDGFKAAKPTTSTWKNPVSSVGDLFGGNLGSWTDNMDKKLSTLEGNSLTQLSDTLASRLNAVKTRFALPYGNVFKFGPLSLDTDFNILAVVDWTTK